MHNCSWKFVCFFALIALIGHKSAAQEVLDRIVARVEGDVILLSEVRALSRYQQLVDGRAESDGQIVDRLIDQWIVRNEADTARFPRPSATEVARGLERVQSSFGSAQEYVARRDQCGLSADEVMRLVAQQLYLTNYLDSRFRSSIQIDSKQIEDFYQTAVVARAKARNQTPPSLEASKEYIQQALVQREINEQTERWLKESHARLHVEKFLDTGVK